MKPERPEPLAWSVWTTAWGPVGGAVGTRGLGRFFLPGHTIDELTDLLAGPNGLVRRSDRPLRRLMALSRAYFRGRAADFREIDCELPRTGTFAGKVLRACRAIGPGRTRSYGEIAGRIGCPGGARAVAGALARNPIPLIVPCHRVVCADGGLGGFSAVGGVELKRRMLELERSADRSR